METSDRPVEIKDLNKTQLIMLAILLSFVTSIATGIVTVTLMQQAPPAVTQTINRVVQQTIEKAVPNYISGKTQTVIVKEDELVVDAVSKARTNIGTLFANKDSKESLGSAYSLGAGNFLVPSATIDATLTYSILVPFEDSVADGIVRFDAKVVGVSPLGFSLLEILNPVDRIKNLPQMDFAKDAMSKIGQTMVIVGPETISKSILLQKTTIVNVSDPTLSAFRLNPQPAFSSDGALVVDLDGNVAGIVLPRGDGSEEVIGADAITKFIAKPLVTELKVVPPTPASTATN